MAASDDVDGDGEDGDEGDDASHKDFLLGHVFDGLSVTSEWSSGGSQAIIKMRIINFLLRDKYSGVEKQYEFQLKALAANL
jgi:hypothetical protein